ncbi:hypothetical protein BDW71DRAFT_69624 [Aspergillus fruticulosus]
MYAYRLRFLFYPEYGLKISPCYRSPNKRAAARKHRDSVGKPRKGDIRYGWPNRSRAKIPLSGAGFGRDGSGLTAQSDSLSVIVGVFSLLHYFSASLPENPRPSDHDHDHLAHLPVTF